MGKPPAIPLTLSELSELFRPASMIRPNAVQVVVIDNKRRIVVSGGKDAYGVVTLKTVPEEKFPALSSPIIDLKTQQDSRPGCHAGRDGECYWSKCPQLVPGQRKSHCPLDIPDLED